MSESSNKGLRSLAHGLPPAPPSPNKDIHQINLQIASPAPSLPSAVFGSQKQLTQGYSRKQPQPMLSIFASSPKNSGSAP
jgi:hypothetical protein